MLEIKASGSFGKTEKFLQQMKELDFVAILNQYGAAGVSYLAAATPVDTGLTASSWYYEIEKKRGKYSIVFKNSNTTDGVPVAILIQYGHGTGTGGYVVGYDYINPVIKPLFDNIAEEIWRRVKQ